MSRNQPMNADHGEEVGEASVVWRFYEPFDHGDGHMILAGLEFQEFEMYFSEVDLIRLIEEASDHLAEVGVLKRRRTA